MATFVLVPGAWAGGWVWRKVGSRLRAAGHEVYTPTPTGLGERVHDADRNLAARHAAERAELGTTADPAYLPAPVDYLRARVPDEADLAWLVAKMVPHPVATLTQPLRLGNPVAAALPRAYVFCTEGKEPGFQSVATAARLRADPGWRYREIASTHLAPVTAPEETVAALLSLV